MAPMDVGSAIGPAWGHMVRVLFRPFDWKKWLGLGFVALFAGNGGSGGRINFPSGNESGPNISNWDTWLAQYWPLLIAGVVFVFLLVILLTWVSSVLNFVYIEDVIRGSGAIREPFARLKRLGTSLFLFRLAFGLIVLVVIGLLVGLPLLAAFLFVRDAGTGLKALSVIWAILLGIPLIIGVGLVGFFAQDWVSNTMYVRRIGIVQAWRVVWPIIKENAGQTLLYLLLVFVFSFGIGIAAIFALLAIGLALAIPFGGIALIVYLAFQSLHIGWSTPLIAAASVYAFLVLMLWIYLTTCAVQPGMVFLRAYSLIVLGQADPTLETIGGNGR